MKGTTQLGYPDLLLLIKSVYLQSEASRNFKQRVKGSYFTWYGPCERRKSTPNCKAGCCHSLHRQRNAGRQCLLLPAGNLEHACAYLNCLLTGNMHTCLCLGDHMGRVLKLPPYGKAKGVIDRQKSREHMQAVTLCPETQ